MGSDDEKEYHDEFSREVVLDSLPEIPAEIAATPLRGSLLY
jgi:hypothetical protein